MLWPTTWMSIGEGRPKFRIWLTISAGRNEKLTPGKSWGKLDAQIVNVVVGGAMLLVETDKNIGVGRADGSGRAVREIDSAVRQADVVDDAVDLLLRDLLADAGFDVVAKARSVLDTCSGAGAQVKAELTAVH